MALSFSPAITHPLPLAGRSALMTGVTRRITFNTIDPGPTDTGWPSPEVYKAVSKASRRGGGGGPTMPRA